METLELSTVVYCSKSDVFDFLVDFPRYADLSDYLRTVRQDGDGSPGTNYALTFEWWKLSYTAHSTVTATDRPNRIDWELTRDIDASGSWILETQTPPADRADATRIRFLVDYDPDSAAAGIVNLPRFVSIDWLVGKVKPRLRSEAEGVLRRLVTELEGQPRSVELEVHTTPKQ